MVRTRRLLLPVALLALVAACAHDKGARVSPGEVAKSRYLLGMDALDGGDYEEAIGYFKQVMRVPGFVRLAANARLRIGDALFLQDKYEQAIAQYRGFLREYEGDDNAPYAQLRIGQAYYQQIPSDWFLAPPRYERQQNAVRQAAAALRQFVRLYPTSPLMAEAQPLLDDCEQQLYEHEAYVAHFYHKREKPNGVIHRLERAFQKYPDHAGTEENYLMLAKAYADTSRYESAAALYQAYLDRFPQGKFRGDAAESLQVLKSIPPAPPVPAPKASGDGDPPIEPAPGLSPVPDPEVGPDPVPGQELPEPPTLPKPDGEED